MHDDERGPDIVPGWDQVLDASTVPPVEPALLARARQAVWEAAAEEVARPSTRKASRWSWRLSLAAIGAGAAVAGVVTFALVGGSPEAVLPEPGPSFEAVTGTGALREDGSAASCVEEYNLETLRNRAFAFDGSVLAIGDVGDDLYAAVTFEVHEWFRGDGDSEITLAMTGPGLTEDLTSESGPAYSVGTRLLVTGEPRWGGATFDDPVAWTCGFTRYYDEATAAQWRDALAGPAG